MSGNGEYEFTSEQNDIVRRLALSMRLVGLALLAAVAALGALFFLFTETGSAIVAVLQAGQLIALVAAGLWTTRAASHMNAIVDTEGSDIAHLMNALDELRKLFTLWIALFVVSMLLLGAVFALEGSLG